MYHLNHYVVDYNKVKTLEDIKLILQAAVIAFEPDHPMISEMLHFLELEAKNTNNIQLC